MMAFVLLVLAEMASDGQTTHEMFKGWFKVTKVPCEMMDTVCLNTVHNNDLCSAAQLGYHSQRLVGVLY
jgi:hypothetical protein